MSLFPFSRKRDGVHFSFAGHERSLIEQLVSQIVTLLEERDEADPAVARLLPAGYRGDDDADAEFRRLTVDDLTARKVETATLVLETLAGDPKAPLSKEAEQAWLRTLNDVRLTLGTRLGVTADGFDAPADQEAAYLRAVYEWLGFVQETLVRALDR
ncbi:uncharacterized protein DUF2017 [Frondihabitans sp. PhB188]|uniref:DUF2017 domain-containing protein n=1 Tax=Frondihabitans sp. PhB188 TaxID=2485200 RepID=UPI000FB35E26|nr:DUF2017 domain-containing protein [Frondihabitans sp. PhB188]ROQ37504.1 uncharacterized protein DUF2017 [Frondihabitans sp. PhB188]